MTVRYYPSFERDYQRLSGDMQSRVERAIQLLIENPRHPSLRIKKMQGSNVWEGRVTVSYRFTFEWEDDVVTFRRVGPHDILEKS